MNTSQLLLLVENEGLVMTREILSGPDLGIRGPSRRNACWMSISGRSVRKLGDALVWIETIRGVGYRFRPV